MPRRCAGVSFAVPMSIPRYSCIASALITSASRARANSMPRSDLPDAVGPTTAITDAGGDPETGFGGRSWSGGTGAVSQTSATARPAVGRGRSAHRSRVGHRAGLIGVSSTSSRPGIRPRRAPRRSAAGPASSACHRCRRRAPARRPGPRLRVHRPGRGPVRRVRPGRPRPRLGRRRRRNPLRAGRNTRARVPIVWPCRHRARATRTRHRPGRPGAVPTDAHSARSAVTSISCSTVSPRHPARSSSHRPIVNESGRAATEPLVLQRGDHAHPVAGERSPGVLGVDRGPRAAADAHDRPGCGSRAARRRQRRRPRGARRPAGAAPAAKCGDQQRRVRDDRHHDAGRLGGRSVVAAGELIPRRRRSARGGGRCPPPPPARTRRAWPARWTRARWRSSR